MKIFWFTNSFIPSRNGLDINSLKSSGGWMLALCEALRLTEPSLKLAVATSGNFERSEQYVTDHIDCFLISSRKKNAKQILDECKRIIEEWEPDLIHIHGTEQLYGQLSGSGAISVPTVISIQGLMGPYSEWNHFFGNRTLSEIVRIHRFIALPFLRGPIWDWMRYRSAASREAAILSGNKSFMGRTNWDNAHVLWANPKANYYHVGELIRKPFWDEKWELGKCRRNRLVITGATHPRKGAELLFKAIDGLKERFSDLELVFVGALRPRSGYGAYIKREIRKRSDFVSERGALNASEMAKELVNAHLLVSPSYIENSPNSVCEAQLLGLPVVSSFSGGLSSLISDGYTGVLFPSGDEACLARSIQRILDDDSFAASLGEEGYKVARERHDQNSVVNQLLECYSDVIHRACTGGS